jgi:hypothetical protein
LTYASCPVLWCLQGAKGAKAGSKSSKDGSQTQAKGGGKKAGAKGKGGGKQAGSETEPGATGVWGCSTSYFSLLKPEGTLDCICDKSITHWELN